MIAETGHFAMILAFCVALLQSTLPLYGARRNHQGFVLMAVAAAQLQFFFLPRAFSGLAGKIF